jgi:hypothetical protein
MACSGSIDEAYVSVAGIDTGFEHRCRIVIRGVQDDRYDQQDGSKYEEDTDPAASLKGGTHFNLLLRLISLTNKLVCAAESID